MSTQRENLERVRQRLDPVVLEFCRAHIGAQFHMEDLVKFVKLTVPGSPDSPSRILRYLRTRGEVSYRVLSRSQSLYLIESASVAVVK